MFAAIVYIKYEANVADVIKVYRFLKQIPQTTSYRHANVV